MKKVALIVVIICINCAQAATAAECILTTEFGINHRATIADKNNQWVDAHISLPAEHNDNQDYLRMQAHGTWKSGHENSILKNATELGRYIINHIGSWSAYIWQGVTTNSWINFNPTEKAAEQTVSSLPTCELDNCFVNTDINGCLARGSVISDSSPRPCILRDGIGLIGKFVLEKNQFYDGGDTYTFFAHMNEYTKEGIPYFTFVPKQGRESSQLPPGKDLKGKLYLRILDNYPASYGGYNVKISSDLKEKDYGFFSEAFSAFEKTILTMGESLTKTSFSSWTLHDVFTSIITFYIAIFGLAFMTGFIPYKIETMIRHLLKICLICALTHPNVFMFCIDIAEKIFLQASKEIADIIMHASMKEMIEIMHDVPHEHTGIGMLEVYDSIISSYFSPGLHLKVLSLFFSKYFMFIPLIYAAIWIFTMACVRSAILYIISTSILVVLLAMGPIMICTMLFKMSKGIFDSWIRSVINCSLLNIFTTAAMGLFAAMFLEYTVMPFQYAICHESLSTSSYISNLLDIKIWKPHNIPQLDRSMTVSWFSYLLVICIFRKVIDAIPDIVESIAPTLYSPLLRTKYTVNTLEQRTGMLMSLPTGTALGGATSLISRRPGGPQ